MLQTPSFDFQAILVFWAIFVNICNKLSKKVLLLFKYMEFIKYIPYNRTCRFMEDVVSKRANILNKQSSPLFLHQAERLVGSAYEPNLPVLERSQLCLLQQATNAGEGSVFPPPLGRNIRKGWCKK